MCRALVTVGESFPAWEPRLSPGRRHRVKPVAVPAISWLYKRLFGYDGSDIPSREGEMKDIHDITKPLQMDLVKNINELIRLKQMEIHKLQRELEALQIVRQVLSEEGASESGQPMKEERSAETAKLSAAQMLP
jgi:hypothetical protein